MQLKFAKLYQYLVDFFTPERRMVFGLFLVSRALFVAIALFLPRFVAQGPVLEQVNNAGGFFRHFIFWDANWYQLIAREGYQFATQGQSAVAFFPLYPAIIHLTSHLVPNFDVAQLLVSNIFFLLAMFAFYRLVLLESKDATIARLSVLFMSFSYGTIWFATGYSESLFLWLTISYFLAARNDQNWQAFFLGFLSGITRGGAMCVLFLVMVMKWRDIDRLGPQKLMQLAPIAISPLLGFLGHLLLVQWTEGDWRTYFVVNRLGWGAQYSLSLQTVVQKIPFIGYSLSMNDPYLNYINWSWFGMTIVIIFTVYVLRKTKTALWWPAYALWFIGFFLFTRQRGGLMDSMARYSSVIFPIYYALGIVASKNKIVAMTLLAVSTLLMTLIATMLFSGYLIN